MSAKSSSAKSSALAFRFALCVALAIPTAGRAAGGASPDEPPAPAPVPPAPPRETSPAQPAGAAVIGEIRKTHNVDLGGGRLALRLTVPATVLGMKDRPLALTVWFADEQGKLVRSVLPEWADANGNLRVESRTATAPSDRADYEFVLSVPYGAFPCRGGAKWRVEARAELHLRDAAGPAAPLATGTTSFFVE